MTIMYTKISWFVNIAIISLHWISMLFSNYNDYDVWTLNLMKNFTNTFFFLEHESQTRKLAFLFMNNNHPTVW